MADNTQNPNTLSLPFVEGLYAEFLRDPSGVPPEWRGYFERIAESNGFASNPRLSPSFPRRSLFGRGPVDGRNGSRANAPFVSAELEPSYVGAPRDGALAAAPAPFPRPAPSGQKSAYSLIQAYRLRGHLAARIDPLESPRPEPPDLDPRFHGFTESDLDQPVSDSLGARAAGTLRELIARLRAIYCGPVGIQYNHIHDVAVRAWLEARFENVEFQAPLAPQEERRVLERLTAAAIFEEFIQRKYIGSKSFSLEGSESLIPLLDAAVE